MCRARLRTVRTNRLRRCLNSNDAAGRAAAGYLIFARAKKGNPKVWPKRASMRGPDIRTSLDIKSTPRSRRKPLRLLAEGGAARRRIPAPRSGSRSRREPRYARRFPPSAVLGRKPECRGAHGCARAADARRRLRVPTSKPTPFTEKRDIVCVGWVRRGSAVAHRTTKNYVAQFAMLIAPYVDSISAHQTWQSVCISSFSRFSEFA